MSRTRHPIARAAAAIAAAVVSLGTLSACAGGGGATPIGGVTDDSWTVMTYMIADTNLEYFQLDDMREQAAVGSRPGFNLISYLDRSEKYSAEDVLGLGDFTGAKIIKVKRGTSEVLRDVGESNTGDPDVLADFIATTVQQFPAAHYALIFNDHGSSWPGVGADGSNDNDQLTLAELQQGISAGLEQANLDKLDLVGFDACLMASYETASILQPLADRMLASEELEPGYGWDYTALETAARGGTVDELAASIIKAFGEQSLAEGESQITLSELDLTKVPALDTAVDDFAAALTADVDDLQTTIGKSLAQSLAYGRTPDYDFYMTDLGNLAEGIGGAEADAVRAAIDDVVIAKVDGAATRGATGVAIYFPPQKAKFKDGYTKVPSAQNWIGFLNAFYQAGQTGGAAPAFASPKAESGFQNGGFVVAQKIVSNPAQVTSTYVIYGYVENGTPVIIGDEAAFIDEDGYAVGFFDTYQLWIGDGSTETSFYSSFSVNRDSNVATVGVPILYFPATGDPTQGFLQMTYAPSTGTILSETFYGPDASGAYAEIFPESGATFEALKVRVQGGVYEYYRSAEGVALDADPDKLRFDYRRLDSGTTVYAEVRIENAAGQLAASAATGVIP